MISVRDFPSVQAALDAAEDGTCVEFPGFGEYQAPAGGWQITRSVTLKGSGYGAPNQDGGTILKPFNANDPVFSIMPPVRNVAIRHMELRGTGTPGTGVGILCRSTATNPTLARGIRLEGLAIHRFGGHGVHFHGYNTGAARVAGVRLEYCLVELCGGCGVRFDNTVDVEMASCLLQQNQMNGVAAFGSGVALYACSFDRNALLSSWSPALNPNDGQLRLELCDVARVDSCEFLGIDQSSVKRGCVIVDSGGAMIGACYFEAAGSGTRYGIVVRGAHGPVVVLSNRFKNIERLVTMDPGVTNCMVFPQGEATSVGSMTLPTPNEGMFGGAQVLQASGNVPAGLIIPSSASDPTEGLREGMLAYHATGQALRMFKDSAWRTVKVQDLP